MVKSLNSNEKMTSLSRILHQNRLVRSKKYHKTMDTLFQSQMVYSPHLDVPFNPKMFIFSAVSFVNMMITTIKCIAVYIIEPYSDLSFLIGDPTFYLKEGRSFMCLLLFDWLTGCVIQYTLLLIYLASSWDHKYTWLCVGEVLSTGQYKNWGSFDNIVKLYYRQIKLNCFVTSVGFFTFANLPAVITAPRSFLIPMTIHALLHSWAAFMAIAASVNFSVLYALYIYVWSQYLIHISSKLTKLFMSKKYLPRKFHLDSIKLSDIQISRELAYLTEHYQELLESCQFYGPRNGFLFTFTFVANTFVMFLVFFTPIPPLYKIAVALCGIFASFCGQFVQFAAGIYGQSTIDQTMRVIRKILYTKSPTSSRLIVLLFNDHFADRHFFTIYGSLKHSSNNLVLTIAESSTLLLLLITNIGGGIKCDL